MHTSQESLFARHLLDQTEAGIVTTADFVEKNIDDIKILHNVLNVVCENEPAKMKYMLTDAEVPLVALALNLIIRVKLRGQLTQKIESTDHE